jgi:hypothetical protein
MEWSEFGLGGEREGRGDEFGVKRRVMDLVGEVNY